MADATAREGSLPVRIFATRAEMGRAAAAEIGDELRRRLAGQDRVRMIFAAAPSQSEMLAALTREPGIDWRRVVAFHMDEYIGLKPGAPERFAVWLRRHLFDLVPFGEVHAIDPEAFASPQACADAYAAALAEAPIDIVCLGIGVNGHIAFNDPPVADLRDPADVKIVELDAICRQQQVDDQCFPSLAEVPTHALTLTVPRLLASDVMVCVVPGPAKRDAVRRTLADPIGEACPSTALRTHARCTLYLDAESAP
ncbi:6-phosphogluconolactonase [Alsobacter ponti]|nr:6-phosphogluconolactonase [Alsobacter ponti]